MITHNEAIIRFLLAKVIVVVVCLCAAAQSDSERRGIEFEGRYWIANSKVFVSFADNINGTDANLNITPNVQSRNPFDTRFTWQITQRNKLRFDYTQLSATGDTAKFAINFAGENYGVNSPALSELDVKQIRIGYAWQGIRLGEKLRFGPLVEARGFWFNASIADPSPLRVGVNGTSAKRSGRFAVGLPVIGADISLVLNKRVEITTLLSGIPAGRYGHLLDAESGVKFFFQRRISLSLGYRYLDLRAKNEANMAELNLRGPVIGAGFKF
jgi:hypothetical protein